MVVILLSYDRSYYKMSGPRASHNDSTNNMPLIDDILTIRTDNKEEWEAHHQLLSLPPSYSSSPWESTGPSGEVRTAPFGNVPSVLMGKILYPTLCGGKPFGNPIPG